IGRLRPGWTADRASAHLAAISRGLFETTLPARYSPEDAKDYLAFALKAFPAATGVSVLRSQYSAPLWLLLGVTGLVLAVACANLANLMMARGATREREVAVRLAIGASRPRIVRQLLAESLLIACAGSAAGLLVARWLTRSLLALLATGNDAPFVDLSLDWRVIVFTTVLAAAACLLFGLAPALGATGVNPGVTMRTSGRGFSEGRSRLRRALVVVQVALSLVLVAGALLFGRTLGNLGTLDAGFRTEGVTVADLDLRKAGIPDDALRAVQAQLIEAVTTLPDVAAASRASLLPVGGLQWNERIVVGDVPQRTYPNFNSV